MLQLIVEGAESKELAFEVRKLLNLGRTPRDQSAIMKHAEELRKQGIPIGPHVGPVFTPKMADRLTTANRIETISEKSSGEAEFVLLLGKGSMWVGVGSDHTDREHQKYSITVAKQLCPNVMAREVWRHEDVKGHWDDLVLRGWVEQDGQLQLYQEGRLSGMLLPEEMIEASRPHIVGDMEGMAIFGGTFPIIGGDMIFCSRFKAELVDERLGRALVCDYTVEPLSWFR